MRRTTAKQYSIYNGLEMSLNARLRNGVQFHVGSSTGQTVTDVLRPGELFGERVNQVDFRVGKILRFRRQRMNLSLDMFNLLKPDAILNYNQLYTVRMALRVIWCRRQ